MNKLTHLDFFSGIGGFALAAKCAGYETVGFCEIEPFCQKILTKHWPNVPIHGDIKTYDGTKFRGQIDLLTGGFPCQPFSVAGKQKGKDDNRYLWPEMLRVIREVRPTWIVGENVAGIINMALEQVCLDLEAEGYEVQPFIIPACAVNAPHRRDRVWIVANPSSSNGWGENCVESENKNGRTSENRGESLQPQHWETHADHIKSSNSNASNTSSEGQLRSEQLEDDRESKSRGWGKPNTLKEDKICWEENWHEVAAFFCRVDDGVSNRVDGTCGVSSESKIPKKKKDAGRLHRLKALGNAIVPQVAFEIIKNLKKG